MIETSKKHLKASASAIKKKTYRPEKKTSEFQSLDLEEIADEIVRKIKVRNKKRIIKSILKRRIKEACELYLEWKDVPHMFCRAFPKYRDELRKVLGNLWEKWWLTSTSNNPPKAVWIIKLKYNEWLFKFAFRGVFR